MKRTKAILEKFKVLPALACKDRGNFRRKTLVRYPVVRPRLEPGYIPDKIPFVDWVPHS
jgi:hypothetical protein